MGGAGWGEGRATTLLLRNTARSSDIYVDGDLVVGKNWVEMCVWAGAVFKSVHQQFSVPIYGGEYTWWGSNLDFLATTVAAASVHFIGLVASRGNKPALQ